MKRSQQYRSMQGIGATRKKLGLSQEVFAMELGISRSLLSKAENRKRSLPTPALIKLSALEMRLSVESMENNAGKKDRINTNEKQAMPSSLEYQCRDYIAEADFLKKQLQLIIKSYETVVVSLEQVELMITDANANGGRFLPAFLEMQKYKMLRKLNRCGLSVQAGLRNKITLLQAAAEMHHVHEKILNHNAG